MSILTGPEIVKRIREGSIIIDPFIPDHVGPNSVDLRLASMMKMYDGYILDARSDNPTVDVEIKEYGQTLSPGNLYLANTVERISSSKYVPFIEGRSSMARLGLTTHLSAGFGDVGFDGQFVLEITVVHPLTIYPGMRICQVAFLETVGELKLYAGRYQGQRGPVASRLWRDATNG